MSTVPVSLCGVFPVSPESFLCAVLLWEERRRFLPIWLPPVGGAQVLGRIGEWEPTRPDTHNLLLDVIEQSTTGVSAIELTGYYNGVYMAQVTMEDGAEFDCRPTDALILALMLDMPIEVEEDVLNQASLWLSAEDAADYFDIEFSSDYGGYADFGDFNNPDSAGGDKQADLAFENLMRELGVEEKDLGFGEADTDHTDRTADTDGSAARADTSGNPDTPGDTEAPSSLDMPDDPDSPDTQGDNEE
ncbi:bifunctional nuclease family protein [Corynebacterium sp. p3-SID1145]|uniref:bifunctional nuclease family protein n=1 Tax=unclassified Corynebacterium TaxID=2624378 RepID=UPI0021AA86B0|nr:MULTISPECIES: bifunctional nuclease family protein [unclassified Corynebacterium]MCT1452920.1 bifunctional nuclease family protein [Corynebacterium sp. p3-SID1145]MCT1461947.1 bifunctional nuclease family protein [Corynebacterium sp. p3-SID1140]